MNHPKPIHPPYPQDGTLHTQPRQTPQHVSSPITGRVPHYNSAQEAIQARYQQAKQEQHRQTMHEPQWDHAQQHIPASHQTFFTPETVSDADYDQKVMKSPKPVIVLFTIPSCTACLSLKQSALQALYFNFKDQWMIYEYVCGIDTQTDKDNDITGHPAMLFYHRGQEIGTYLGYSQYEYYASYIKSLAPKLKRL